MRLLGWLIGHFTLLFWEAKPGSIAEHVYRLVLWPLVKLEGLLYSDKWEG